MITNLVCSVVIALVTNTTDRFPQHLESDSPPFNPKEPYGMQSVPAVFYGHFVNDAEPDKKWVKTSIARVTTVSFNLNGEDMKAVKEEPISESEQEFVLVKHPSEWIKKP